VLFVTSYLRSFNLSFLLVVGAILAITFGVTLHLREPPTPRAVPMGPRPSGLGQFWAELRSYIVTAAKSMFGSRVSVAALVLALLPCGAYALSLALQSNLAVELGLPDRQIGYLSAASTACGAVGCVAGGWLSDQLGRRKALATYVVAMAIPNLVLAWAMHRYEWIMPVDPRTPNRPVPAAWLVQVFWAATLVYTLLNGLMYGARSALYMDISNPRVAATQFTAYMAMMNLVIAYSAAWQGKAVVRWGYPKTLVIDAAFGLLCLAVLPFTMTRVPYAKAAAPEEDERGFEVAPPSA
jgi:MFS family permease